MIYLQAGEEHAEQVVTLVHDTIKSIYPKYYPKEVVDFFCSYHDSENIKTDIKNKNVWLLFYDNQLVGTGSGINNQITRVYVLPAFQRNGYGSYIMQQLEDEIGRQYNEAVLDALLPASRLYEKRGYNTVRYENRVVENGVVLVYEVMKNELPRTTTAICYNGKSFIPKVNAANGEVDSRTIFFCHQTGDIVSGKYSGGDIIKGHLLGTVASNGKLDFHYQHININGQIRIGKCYSVPQIFDSGV
jgi:GNAT superfamily N-acetyltransferase